MGAAPPTPAMVAADLKVATQLDAEAATSAALSSASGGSTSGSSTTSTTSSATTTTTTAPTTSAGGAANTTGGTGNTGSGTGLASTGAPDLVPVLVAGIALVGLGVVRAQTITPIETPRGGVVTTTQQQPVHGAARCGAAYPVSAVESGGHRCQCVVRLPQGARAGFPAHGAGKVTALIGPSGCGKSTFLRILNRMHELVPICIAFRDRSSWTAWTSTGPTLRVTETRLKIGMVFQRPNPFPSMTIAQNVLAGLRLSGTKVTNRDALVKDCLERAGLWREARNRLNEAGAALSGGQQQRLCIARALAVRPKVLLMDEPCSALDPISTGVIEETIRELSQELTIVIVTHNMQQAQRVSDTVRPLPARQRGRPGPHRRGRADASRCSRILVIRGRRTTCTDGSDDG